MDWRAWAPTYRAILDDFGYDPAQDEAARDLLDELLADALRVDERDLRARMTGEEVHVVGGAAREEDVRRIRGDAPLLVADAACPAVIPARRPDAIVTDIDGDVSLQIAANALGVPLFLHAHGDNVPALRAHARSFRGPLQGTTQAEPRGRIHNYGGFTDGDRACCLAAHLGARSLVLVGFDYERPAVKPGSDPGVKLRKLAWARRIVDGLGIPVRHA